MANTVLRVQVTSAALNPTRPAYGNTGRCHLNRILCGLVVAVTSQCTADQGPTQQYHRFCPVPHSADLPQDKLLRNLHSDLAGAWPHGCHGGCHHHLQHVLLHAQIPGLEGAHDPGWALMHCLPCSIATVSKSKHLPSKRNQPKPAHFVPVYVHAVAILVALRAASWKAH